MESRLQLDQKRIRAFRGCLPWDGDLGSQRLDGDQPAAVVQPASGFRCDPEPQ